MRPKTHFNTTISYHYTAIYLLTFVVKKYKRENAMQCEALATFPFFFFHPPRPTSLKLTFAGFLCLSLLPFLLSFHSICSAKRKGAFSSASAHLLSCFSFAHFSCLLCVCMIMMICYFSLFLNTFFCSIFILLLLFFSLSF